MQLLLKPYAEAIEPITSNDDILEWIPQNLPHELAGAIIRSILETNINDKRCHNRLYNEKTYSTFRR